MQTMSLFPMPQVTKYKLSKDKKWIQKIIKANLKAMKQKTWMNKICIKFKQIEQNFSTIMLIKFIKIQIKIELI